MTANKSKSPGRLRLRHWPLAALAVFAAATLVDSALAEPRGTPSCLQFWPESRARGYGYDHIVHLSNACEARAVCFVSSDADPTPVQAFVSIGEQVEVPLAYGSTVREFKPRVECGMLL